MLKALGFKVRNVLDVVDDDVSVGKFVLSIPSQNLCQYLRQDYQNWRFFNKLTGPRRNEARHWENMHMNAFSILILQALGNSTRKLEKKLVNVGHRSHHWQQPLHMLPSPVWHKGLSHHCSFCPVALD